MSETPGYSGRSLRRATDVTRSEGGDSAHAWSQPGAGPVPRPANEDRFLATFCRIKRYRAGSPAKFPRALERSGGARGGTRLVQRMRSVRNCLTARLSHTASAQSSFSRVRKRFTRIFSSLSAVFLRLSLAVSCFMGCAFLKMSHPRRSLFMLSRVRLICRGRVAVRVLCSGSWPAVSGRGCCPFFQGWVKGHFLNFETGAGVKYKSSSAPASVISSRLMYPHSPSGQSSDFTNPNACACSGSASFSVIHQSHEPMKKCRWAIGSGLASVS